MRASLPNSLRPPRPDEIELYLSARTWKRSESTPRYSTWTLPYKHGQTFEVVVAQDRMVRDYDDRVVDLLETVATAEGRTPETVMKDIVFVDRDVVRVRAAGEASTENTLAIPAMSLLLQSATSMMTSAACAAHEGGVARPLYSGRKPNAVTEYLRALRMGQTEPGSYVLTVLSPLRKTADEPGQMDLQFREGHSVLTDPFRRSVTRMLGVALVAARSAATKARSGQVDPFEEAVERGVSANLLEAVGAAAQVDRLGELSINITWAPLQSEPTSAPHSVTFARALLEKIQYAGEVMRSRHAPRNDFVLQGYVRKLERPQDAFIGRAMVEGAVEGRMRKVTVELMGAAFAAAHQALGEEQEVLIECSGNLVKTSTGYTLRDAHDVRRVPPEELDRVSDPAPLLDSEST